MSILQINGADIPAPKTCKIGIADQDFNSDTDANAELHRNRVAVKRKISYSAPPLQPNEISSLLQAITDQFFTLEYPDPQTGTRKSITVYCGDRTAPVYSCINGKYLWEGLTVDFIER